MVIIMPNTINGLPKLAHKIRKVSFFCEKGLSLMSERTIEVYLPKFKIETKLELGHIMSSPYVRRHISEIIY